MAFQRNCPLEFDFAYGEGRKIHAMLLRCEGCSLREISERIGVSTGQARHLVMLGGALLDWSMRSAKARVDFQKLKRKTWAQLLAERSGGVA